MSFSCVIFCGSDFWLDVVRPSISEFYWSFLTFRSNLGAKVEFQTAQSVSPQTRSELETSETLPNFGFRDPAAPPKASPKSAAHQKALKVCAVCSAAFHSFFSIVIKMHS